MNKTIVCASITKRKLKLQRKLKLVPHRILRRWCLSPDRRRHLSADELSVFSSALRPCLRFLLDSNTKPKTFPEWHHIKNGATIATLGIASFLVFSTSPSAYAENSTMTLTVPANLNVQVVPGKEMQKNTGKVSISTTAAFGYTLGIKAKADGTALTSAENNTIPSITTATKTIAANTSAWGWRAGAWSGATGDPDTANFEASPTKTSTTTIEQTNAGGTKDYYLTIAASASGEQQKGTYTKDFTITAAATSKTYKVTYDSKGGTAVAEHSESTYTSKANFTTRNTTPTKNYYVFKGWCSADTNNATCPAITCQPNQSCTIGGAVTASTTSVPLYAMWDEKSYTIKYNGNGGSNVPSNGSAKSGTNTLNFTTDSKTPTKTGYDFKGWCTASTTNENCSGQTCQPGQACNNIAVNTDTTTINLYAMWKDAEIRDISLLTSMQHWGRITDAEKTKVLASMTTNQQYELKDERDQRMYYISKLADGNIWMTENLDLDLSTSKALTPNDTDITANWTPTRSTLTTTTGWTNDSNTPYSYDPSNRCWNGTITSGSGYTISSSAVAKDCSKHDSSHYHVGNYYNWSAAVAMNNTSSYTTNLTNLNQSICPKGWQLPVYSGNKSFDNLRSKVTSAGGKFTAGPSGTIHKAPFYFPYSGDFVSGASHGVGYWAWFWSSVVRSSSLASYMYFDYGMGLNPQNDSSRYRYYGFSVRCVAR